MAVHDGEQHNHAITAGSYFLLDSTNMYLTIPYGEGSWEGMVTPGGHANTRRELKEIMANSNIF